MAPAVASKLFVLTFHSENPWNNVKKTSSHNKGRQNKDLSEISVPCFTKTGPIEVENLL